MFQEITVSYILLFLSIFFTLFKVIESGYVFFFNKPLFVHFYFFKQKISDTQKQILRKNFSFYNRLSNRKKRYFEHRVAVFIKKYPFYGRKNIVITEEVKTLIASTAIMLTFGMRRYLFTSINKIIIYPTSYFSTINNQYHKGEFNPKMRVVVFSWEDFLEGLSNTTDNINLGLHEFAHVLHYDGLKRKDTSAIIFSSSYNELLRYLKKENNLKRIIDSNYFRIYAYTNSFEFIAVLLEHFFETPQQFKTEFPELFTMIQTMINFSKKRTI